MYCQSCGAKISESSPIYCHKCGVKLASIPVKEIATLAQPEVDPTRRSIVGRFCTKCKTPIEDSNQKKCHVCGNTLTPEWVGILLILVFIAMVLFFVWWWWINIVPIFWHF